MSFNRIILEGRITRDFKVETTPSGTKYCNYDVAIDDGFGSHKKTTFVTVTSWAKQSQFVLDWFSKGDGILIEGRLSQDRWTDKATGDKRQRHRVTAEHVFFPVGSKRKNEHDQGEATPEDESQEPPADWATEFQNQDSHPL